MAEPENGTGPCPLEGGGDGGEGAVPHVQADGGRAEPGYGEADGEPVGWCTSIEILCCCGGYGKKRVYEENTMCDLTEIVVGNKYIRVAEIKKEYIENIINSIPLCSAIDKVILFGSALESRCTDSSDVDIAIFGKYPKTKMYKMKVQRFCRCCCFLW